MVRLTKGRREFLGEKFGDLANLAVAALVFGQAIGQVPFSPGVGLAGMGIWLGFMAFGFALKGGR